VGTEAEKLKAMARMKQNKDELINVMNLFAEQTTAAVAVKPIQQPKLDNKVMQDL
jgi:hypothetical protein